MRLGIYVGSFNPVHNGHKYVADYLLDNNYIDKIIMIPTGNYWNKQDLIDIHDRINMLKYYQSDKIIIDSDLGVYQYTYQVLRELKKKYSNDLLYLIIGADNIIDFDMWKEYEEILNNMLIILPRNEIDVNKYLIKFNKIEKFILVSNFEEIKISSTEVRDLIKRKKYDKVKKMVADNVFKYIVDKKLYM